MKKYKICHLSSAHPASDIRIFHKECVSLAKDERFDVYLLTINSRTEKINNVQLVSVESKSKNRFTRILNSSRAVYKKALKLDADIYHFHDPELLPYGLKLIRRGKIVIYDAHEDVPRQILSKHWIPLFLRKSIANLYESYENYVAKRLSFVVTSTPTIEKRYKKINPNSSAICNYPILEENVVLPEWSTRNNEICYVGGITVVRGINEIVKVLELDNDLQINLAGAFSPLTLRDDLIKSNSWKQVNEYGVVDRNEILKILNKSKIGMVTLHPIENYLDSLPIKMFEYMYAGIPLIASDFPLWKELISENKCGYCVDPFDITETYRLIQTLLSNDDLAKKMGENGRKSVLEKYNWRIEEKKLISIYLKLLIYEN
jgi:glycosyltransferase involved in cell wall biosynthesis